MATVATSGSPPKSETLRLRFGSFELDEVDARLTRDGKAVPVAPRPFAVLCVLVRKSGTLVTKEALLDAVWGHRFVTDSVLKTTVSALRAALDDDPREPRYIETVSRRGYRFIGSVSGAAALVGAIAPMPSAAVQATPVASSIIGRSDAIERSRSAWQLARAGKRRIVWVAGEPGVGKTTLIEHFMSEVGEAYCAHGQCVGHAGEPYLPVLEAVSTLCRRDASFAELVRAAAPTWLLQIPWLSTAAEREALRRDVAGSGQVRMLREFGELIERYTEERPLLLVTEDLHWSDAATLQLMDHTARRREPARLLWVASFRLTEVIATDHSLKSLRHELRLHGLSEEIVLDAFSETEVADYVAAKLPRLGADETFVQALHARTEGLPLFVADVVNDLVTHGDVTQEGESSARSRLESMPIPENLAGVIEQYMERLTPEERVLLEAASVCGVVFRLNTLAEVLESDLAKVARTCLELVRQQRWLVDVPLEVAGSTSHTRYAFRHALYREIFCKRIGSVARAELHRKVAVALERERAEGAVVTAAELASHFELAHELTPALRYYTEAAEWALLHFSPQQTMSLTERALAFLPMAESGDARTNLEITLATLQGAAAIQVCGISANEVKHAFQRALSRLDDAPQHPLRGLFLSAFGLALYMRGEPDEAYALAQRCESLSAARNDRTALLCACLVHGLVQHSRGRPRIARKWLEKGLLAHEGLDEITRPAVVVADPGVIILGFLAFALLHAGLIDEGRARIREAYARARASGAPGPQMAALWLETLFEVRLDNPQHVAALSERLRAFAEEHGFPQGRAAHLWFRGWAEAQLGDARAGHRLIGEGYNEALRLGNRAWGSETLGYAVEALARNGEWPAARQELEQAMQCAEAIGERHYLPQLLVLDARIADALGEPKRAKEALRQALAEARAQEAPWLEMVVLTALCERKDATARDHESLRRVIEKIRGGEEAAPVARARAAVGLQCACNGH
jgi:DNA-binding winged helix-turn-helix (wHTH) protein/tetratricopeptide (TPR) repeat protein